MCVCVCVCVVLGGAKEGGASTHPYIPIQLRK